MAHKLDGVLAAVVAALGVASVTTQGHTVTKPTGTVVHRNRHRSIEQEDLDTGPAFLVFWAGDKDPVDTDAVNQVTRYAKVAVEIRAKQSGASPDAALLPLLAWAVKSIMADVTLAGACKEITEGMSKPSLEEREDGLCAALIVFEAEYRTAHNDAEILG